MTAANLVSARLRLREPMVVLEMPEDVAVTLRDLTGRVSGGSGTYREHTNSISLALDNAGVRPLYYSRLKGRVEALDRE